MYYAQFDSNGFPTTFFYPALYPQDSSGNRNASIPADAVQVPDAQWSDLINGKIIYLDGIFVPYTRPTLALMARDIDAERDRRCYGGFIYNGKAYQTDPTSIANVLGSAQLAFMAIVSGAQAGNLRWANPNEDFAYIATDNTSTAMDAHTVVDFAKNAATFRSMIIFAGRALKNALAAGQAVDIYADESWGVDYTSPTSTYQTDPAGSPGCPTGPSGPSGPTGPTGPTGPQTGATGASSSPGPTSATQSTSGAAGATDASQSATGPTAPSQGTTDASSDASTSDTPSTDATTGPSGTSSPSPTGPTGPADGSATASS